MKSFHPRQIMSFTAVLAASAVVAVAAAQGGTPPPDDPESWLVIPHCIVPDIEGLQLSEARSALQSANCSTYKQPMRKRSTAKRNSVLRQYPDAGMHFAPGTNVLLVVAR